MADYILQTQNLSKNFKKQVAVNALNIRVPRGEIYGLLGPNGAGKSTFLKMICGMIKPSSGTICFNNHSWNRSDLSEIGALIENAPLYPHLTAYENCYVRTLALGIEKSRINEVLEIVGLLDTGKKKNGSVFYGDEAAVGYCFSINQSSSATYS